MKKKGLEHVLYSTMKNYDFSYASYISVLNACIANLPLPFSIIISKYIFEVSVLILFRFSMKLSIDLFPQKIPVL